MKGIRRGEVIIMIIYGHLLWMEAFVNTDYFTKERERGDRKTGRRVEVRGRKRKQIK